MGHTWRATGFVMPSSSVPSGNSTGLCAEGVLRGCVMSVRTRVMEKTLAHSLQIPFRATASLMVPCDPVTSPRPCPGCYLRVKPEPEWGQGEREQGSLPAMSPCLRVSLGLVAGGPRQQGALPHAQAALWPLLSFLFFSTAFLRGNSPLHSIRSLQVSPSGRPLPEHAVFRARPGRGWVTWCGVVGQGSPSRASLCGHLGGFFRLAAARLRATWVSTGIWGRITGSSRSSMWTPSADKVPSTCPAAIPPCMPSGADGEGPSGAQW